VNLPQLAHASAVPCAWMNTRALTTVRRRPEAREPKRHVAQDRREQASGAFYVEAEAAVAGLRCRKVAIMRSRVLGSIFLLPMWQAATYIGKRNIGPP